MSDKNTCCGYPVHEAAALFPLLPEAELKELAEDIKKNGLIYPVIMCDKAVLDGRNRMLACEMVGAGVHFRDFRTYKSEHSPTEWVLATNFKRRNLTASQKAAIAAEAMPLLEAEAKERQRMGKAKLPDPAKEGQARNKAATAAKVSPRYVQDAKRMKVDAPEVFEQLKNGSKSMSAAKEELGWEPSRREPDRLAALKAVWLQCSKQQQHAFDKWRRKHRK